MKRALIFIILMIVSYSSAMGQYNRQYIYATSQNSIIDKRYYDAISLLTLLIESDSVSKDAYFLRAVAKYNLNDMIGAEQDLSAAIRINPVYIEAYQYRAITRSVMGNWDDAVSDFQKAIDIRPDFINTYYSRGVTYLMSQQFDNAISDFTTFIKRNPKESQVYLNRGSAYLMLKDTLNAFNDFNIAVKVSPRSSDALTRRGGLYAIMGKPKEAMSDYNKALHYNPQNKIAYFNRAILNANNNAPLDAIKDFGEVIKIDSTNSLAYFNRAITLSQIGDFNTAMLDYDKVVELSPNNVLGYFNRALLATKLGDLEKAINDYSYCIELYPDFANAYLARSSVRYSIGDMVGSKSDKDTADEKIAMYREKYEGKGDEFSMFADTSRNFNKILAFESNFSSGDKVKETSVDIKLLAMYRLIKTKKITDLAKAENKRYAEVSKFISSSKIDNLIVSNLPVDMSREEIIEERSKRNNSRNTDYLSQPWRAEFEDAISSYSIKQYTSAITELSEAIKSAPDNPLLYMTRSAIYCEMTEFIQSINSTGQRFVIEADKSKELHATKQELDFESALFDITYAIRLNPNIAYFYYNRANIYVLSGDMPKAIEEYTRAIELDNRFAAAFYNRGLVQIYLKEDKKGFLDMSRAGELGITNAYEVIKRYTNFDE